MVQTRTRDGHVAHAEQESECRSCGGGELEAVLALGTQPLANAIRPPDELDRPEPSFPLTLVLCTVCSLLQILESISPEALFSEYPYFSSVIASLTSHARTLATRLTKEHSLGPNSLILEVASNDGYLLRQYREQGIPVLGVDPARNVANFAETLGIPTRCEFFDREFAGSLVAEGIQPDIVHAHNVLAHVPDLNGFVGGIAMLLGERGLGVVEVPYVKELLDKCEFDTVYHEHRCYFSLTALHQLFRRHGLSVERVERLDIHGGSLRLFVRRAAFAEIDDSVQSLLDEEARWQVRRPDVYLEFARQVLRMKAQLKALLADLRQEGAHV